MGTEAVLDIPSAVFQYHPLALPSDGIENGFGYILYRLSARILPIT